MSNDNVNTSANAENTQNEGADKNTPEAKAAAKEAEKAAKEAAKAEKNEGADKNTPGEKKVRVELLSRTGFGNRGDVMDVDADTYKAYGSDILKKVSKTALSEDEVNKKDL